MVFCGRVMIHGLLLPLAVALCLAVQTTYTVSVRFKLSELDAKAKALRGR